MAALREKGRSVPLSEMLAEEAEAAKRDSFPADVEFDPDRDLNFSGPNAFRRNMVDKDQLVIDELLSSLPKNQGYYLKLYKEIMPGKFELKEQIDSYDTWTDMELEVSNRVKAMTRKFGSKKWGSSLYRIVVWKNGGIRERNKYPPIDVIVDAGDTEDAGANMHTGKVDPLEQASEQFAAFGGMLNAMKSIMPASPDPNVQFQALAQAYTAGKGEQLNGGNQSMQMMTMMMTTMMTLMKEIMVGNRPTSAPVAPEDTMAKMMGMMRDFQNIVAPNAPQGPQTLAQQMADLKLIGIDPFKREDTIDQIARLKAVMGSVTDLLPTNGKIERPGIMEKLIDTIGPILPKIIGDMTTMVNNASMAQQIERVRMGQTAQAQNAMMETPPALGEPQDRRPRTSYGQPVGPQPNRIGRDDAFTEPDYDPYSGFSARPSAGHRDDAIMFGPEDFGTPPNNAPVAPRPVVQAAQAIPMEPPLPPLLVELYELVTHDRRDAYKGLYETLMQFEESRQMVNGILVGMVKAKDMAEQLQSVGGSKFNAPTFIAKMIAYLDGFIEWIMANVSGKMKAKCTICQAIHTFESKAHFESSGSKCDGESGIGQICGGQLTIVGGA